MDEPRRGLAAVEKRTAETHVRCPACAEFARREAIEPQLLVRERSAWDKLAHPLTRCDIGGSQVEQGISKAGNKRTRALLVELAWG